MKIESYILRYGSTEEIEELAAAVLRAAGLPMQPEARDFALRIRFAKYIIAGNPDVRLEITILYNKLYISGTSDGLTFTI